MLKIMFLHHCYTVGQGLRSGQGQRGSRSGAAVDIRGAALLSAVKSNNRHYQSKVIVCVSVISGRMRTMDQVTIERMV